MTKWIRRPQGDIGSRRRRRRIIALIIGLVAIEITAAITIDAYTHGLETHAQK